MKKLVTYLISAALKECVDKILKDSSNYELKASSAPIQKPSEPESDTQDAQAQDDKSEDDQRLGFIHLD
jgi:hypothetical protein